MECIANDENLPLQTIVLTVEDEPGTLFLISSVFSNRGISMKSIQMHEDNLPMDSVRLSRLTIRFRGEDSRKKIISRLLSRLDCVIESR